MSVAEAESVVEAFVSAGGSLLFVPTGGGAGLQPAAVPFSQSFDETVACPGGGSIGVSGTLSGDIDDQGGTGTVSMEVRQVHSSCTATASSNGSVWTFDGAPGVDQDFDWTVSETQVAMSGTQRGTIAFSGPASGTCAIDLSFDFSVDATGRNLNGSVSGSVCGVDVSDTFSFTD